MKTMKTLETMKNENLELYRAFRHDISNALKTIETIYNEARAAGDSVKTSLQQMVDAIGFDMVAMVVASMINRASWDGRFSEINKAWAAGLEAAFDKEAAQNLAMYNDIHPANLDQLASAIRRYEPAPAPADEEPAEPAADEAPADEAPAAITVFGVPVNIEQKRTWSAYSVRACCIKYDFYTCGDCESYDHMLQNVAKWAHEPTPAHMLETAVDIMNHSEPAADITLESIMNTLEKEAVTTFYRFPAADEEPAEPAADEEPAEPAADEEPAPAGMVETVLTVGLHDKDSGMQEIETAAAREILDKITLEKYGIFAYTMTDCAGCYKMNDGRIVHEPSLRLEIVTEGPLACLPGMVHDIKTALNQETVMVKTARADVNFL